MKSLPYLSLIASSLLFLECLLSDFLYSNCVSVGSPQISCLFDSYSLQPLVLVNGQWILSPLSQAFQLSLPNTMGVFAGVGFLGIFASVFFLKRSVLLSVMVSGFVYFLMMLGFERFMPYCIAGECRITNYLPWISYSLGFEVVSVAWSVAMFLYFFPRFKRK